MNLPDCRADASCALLFCCAGLSWADRKLRRVGQILRLKGPAEAKFVVGAVADVLDLGHQRVHEINATASFRARFGKRRLIGPFKTGGRVLDRNGQVERRGLGVQRDAIANFAIVIDQVVTRFNEGEFAIGGSRRRGMRGGPLAELNGSGANRLERRWEF
jgi:hypothetical protein